jgi:hypothetical protein
MLVMMGMESHAVPTRTNVQAAATNVILMRRAKIMLELTNANAEKDSLIMEWPTEEIVLIKTSVQSELTNVAVETSNVETLLARINVAAKKDTLEMQEEDAPMKTNV